MITNAGIAKLLRRVEAVYEVKDKDFFRSRAYENAANAVENLTISAHDLWEQGKLDEIPGVGPSLTEHLDELFRTGKVNHFEVEFRRVPAGMFGLLGTRGIGPKIAYKIAKKFKLNDEKTALKKVKQLIAAGKLADLPGFGQKMQAKIKTSIESSFVKGERLLFSEAVPVSSAFIDYIKKILSVTNAEPLGSLRRHVATIGDIDLGIATNKPKETMEAVLKYPQIQKTISSGAGLARVQLKTGHEVDIKLCSPGEWGSLLQHYTGSKLHNIALRSYALESKLSLSEHGIKDLRTKKVFRARDEKSFYTHLGLPYIPPELREGEEELNYAKKNKIPALVELGDIRGDFHLHSDFDFESSHDLGRSKLSEYLDQARNLNYDYLGVSDHNPKRDLSTSDKKKIIEARKKYLITQYREYEKRVKTGVPKLFIGLEIDIRSDGELALEDELLAGLDYAIVSVHNAFDLSKEENTNRLIKALGHPKAVILGHPTARKLNERPGIDVDWEKVINFCRTNSKVLEVNATPDRLDLPDDLVKMAVRGGVKVIIDTDSHEVANMDFMKYGVWTARRGWCSKSDVLNTYSLADLKKVLK
ncbi:MAG: PHP domain-containing protein [Microgenomates group bacterium]